MLDEMNQQHIAARNQFKQSYFTPAAAITTMTDVDESTQE
jgi:hypothetical protein